MAANIWEILSALGQAAAPVKKRPQGMLTSPEMDEEPSNIDIPSIQSFFKQPSGLYQNPASQNLSRSVQSDALDFQSPRESTQSDNLNAQMTEGYPANMAQLYSGAPKKGGFWESGGGKILQTILPLLATSGLGAALGAIASPSGYRGLGAGRGAAMGAKLGFESDIGQRQKAAEHPLELLKQQIQLRNSMKDSKPTAQEEYEWAYGTGTPGVGGVPTKGDFLTQRKINPFAEANYNLRKDTAEANQFQKQYNRIQDAKTAQKGLFELYRSGNTMFEAVEKLHEKLYKFFPQGVPGNIVNAAAQVAAKTGDKEIGKLLADIESNNAAFVSANATEWNGKRLSDLDYKIFNKLAADAASNPQKVPELKQQFLNRFKSNWASSKQGMNAAKIGVTEPELLNDADFYNQQLESMISKTGQASQPMGSGESIPTKEELDEIIRRKSQGGM